MTKIPILGGSREIEKNAPLLDIGRNERDLYFLKNKIIWKINIGYASILLISMTGENIEIGQLEHLTL
jgi:hypothetical protein